MKITYISHASLLIEVNGIKILTDPWIAGPAYCEQWYIFPPPIDGCNELLHDIDFVLLSHGHEDHTHHKTLKLINKSAQIFYPYSWYDGAVEYFKSLGFSKIREALNEKVYKVAKDVEITFYANNLDNIIVIKANGKTIVDVNDALPSTSPEIIDHFVQKLSAKHPKIECLFSSYGGASYYPNTIKCDWKDDVEVGKIRELFFVDNFCKIAAGLNAEFSIPFASDFVLLDDKQLWMNTVKFLRNEVANYFTTHYPQFSGSTQIVEMYPGDQLFNSELTLNSAYHEKFKKHDMNTLIKEVYQNEIDAKRNVTPISEEKFLNLYEKIKAHIYSHVEIVPPKSRKNLLFAIQITDYTTKQFINVDLSKGKPDVSLWSKPNQNNRLLLKVKSKTLNYSIDNEWGGDAIIIGYGCELSVFDKDAIKDELDNYAIQLLTRYPNTKSYIKKNPFRAFKYLSYDKIKRKIFWDKLLNKNKENPYMDSILKEDDLWFNRTGCEICKKCNLPILTNELSAKYYTVNNKT